MTKRVLFVHYRTGERDGVSLEIEKRADIFRKLKWEVYYLSGVDPRSKNRKFKNYINCINLIDIKNPLVEFVTFAMFNYTSISEKVILEIFTTLKNKIFDFSKEIFEKIKPDLVFIHNIFSHAYNLAASKALLEIVQIETQDNKRKVISLNHDFWHERTIFNQPQYDFVKQILTELPPEKPNIHNQVINSVSKKYLIKKGYKNVEKIVDYWDFSKKHIKKFDKFNEEFFSDFNIDKNTLIILQATRITYRKAIENSILFVKHFNDEIKKQTNIININGKPINSNSKAILLLTNFVESREWEYFHRLMNFASDVGIQVIYAADKFSYSRSKKPKIYSFWDGYVISDLVLYPSIQEGYGNQLLESFAFKKLPIVFEYKVFKKDIKKIGFEYISFGSKFRKTKNNFHIFPIRNIKEAVNKSVEILSQKEKLDKILEKNFNLCRKNNSIKIFETWINNFLEKHIL